MPNLTTFDDLLAAARATGRPLDELFLAAEADERGVPAESVRRTFRARWDVMKDSIRRGLAGGKSFSGLVGGDARKVMEFTRDDDPHP